MPDPVEKFLAAYDDEVCSLAIALRALVRRLVPDADEKLLRPWKVVAYGRKKKFCAIAPHASWVNLQFHNGASLDDPKGLLEGTGKSMRHVKVKTAGDLKSRAVAALIREAANDAAHS